MRRICVIGVGYVGLVTGTCFADLGHEVTCVDVDEAKIEKLIAGELPIYEPGLEEMVRRNAQAGRLHFTASYEQALPAAEFVFIAVGTPQGSGGEADLKYVRAAARSIAGAMSSPLIVVNKSTVPIGTGDWVADIVRRHQKEPVPFSVVSNPEFLREGSAINDFMVPDRIVLGSLDADAAAQVAQLYLSLRAPIVITDLRTAEMIKYASNAFLAARLSFINEIANICETLGADIKEVAAGMGYDRRIGRYFLDAGLGYGGSCFEGRETVFALNSPDVVSEPLEALFAAAGPPSAEGGIDVVRPAGRRVLAWDLETGCPTLADVLALTRRAYAGPMVTILTALDRSLRVTADHPVIVRRAAGLSIVPARDVAPGDRLLALCDLPPLEPVAALDLIELLRGAPLEADVYVTAADGDFAAAYPAFAAHVPAEGVRHLADIERHDRMPLWLFRDLAERGVLDIPPGRLRLSAGRAATRIDARLEVDADLLRLAGYYLAAGRIRRAPERVVFRFPESQAERTADVQRILRRWGIEFEQQRRGQSTTTLVASRLFAWLLRDVLRCGARPDDKALPGLAFRVPPELRLELLRGAFGGGALAALRGGRDLAFEYATPSKPLADGLALLLQSLGVAPALRTRRTGKSRRPAYVLRVCGPDRLAVLRAVLGEQHRARIDAALDGDPLPGPERGLARLGPTAALTVEAVEREDVSTTVYSLETSTGTLVAASGLICHNCFPKDVEALAHMASVHGCHPQLLRAVMDINRDQRRQALYKVRELLGTLDEKVIGILGLAFKPNTDDMREAPSVEIIHLLQNEGAQVRAYDPVAMPNAERCLPDVTLCRDAYEAAEGADALIVVTEWNEFKHLSLPRIKALMRQPVIVDGRNIYEPQAMRALGFVYRGIGRGYAS